MALNIFPRQPRRESTSQPEAAPVFEPAPEPLPSPADSDEATTATRRRPTRSRRGAGTRSGTEPQPDEGAEQATAIPEVPEPVSELDAETPPRRRSRSRRPKADEADQQPLVEAETPVEPRPARAPRQSAARATTPVSTAAASTATFDPAPLVRAIEQQGKQIEALTRALQDGVNGGGSSGAKVARVGVFVDVANVELGADRARVRFDWGKVLRLLTRDRTLARAIAYAPVHDDPQVSRETQRFVEPFLDRGYKIVTKPLKRFSDGTIKANVDIELALDIVNMLDRLDVVCLVSGDGDFEPLVRAAQERGVRVEVAAMSNSCAASLRNSADSFIDLLGRVNELRA